MFGDNKNMQRTSREGCLAPAGLSQFQRWSKGVGQRGQATLPNLFFSLLSAFPISKRGSVVNKVPESTQRHGDPEKHREERIKLGPDDNHTSTLVILTLASFRGVRIISFSKGLFREEPDCSIDDSVTRILRRGSTTSTFIEEWSHSC